MLDSSSGPVDLAELAARRAVLYVYPATGIPGRPTPDGWDAIPGRPWVHARSRALSATMRPSSPSSVRALPGLSAQPLEQQIEFARREHMPFPVGAPTRGLELAGRPRRCPTFEFGGATLYKRITLVLEAGRVAKVFYPVFPPDRNAADVVASLRARSGP